MCGRFTLTRTDFDEVAEDLGAVTRPEDGRLYRPRYNIAPTDQHWIARTKQERRELIPATWGLVNSWASDARGAARQINARSETAATARAFRDAFLSRRCVVPADGFFEWKGAKDARTPVWYHAPEGQLIPFAGLYESWRNPVDGEWRRSFTILTTDANETVAPVHNRMPVILDRDQLDEWLFVPADDRARAAQAEHVRTFLDPAPSAALIATDVSTRANSVKNDDPDVLRPALDREAVERPRLL